MPSTSERSAKGSFAKHATAAAIWSRSKDGPSSWPGPSSHDPSPRGRHAARSRQSPTLGRPPVVEPATRSPSLDLHGTTVDEGLDALGAFLNTALLDGNAEVRIIHGRSGGRLKAAVHARLKRMPSIRSFGLDPRNPGVTIVRL